MALPVIPLSPISHVSPQAPTSLIADLFARDFMVSQKWPKKGPWFEGWYIRVTDPDNKRSFAFIVTGYSGSESLKLDIDKSELNSYQTLMIDSPNDLKEPLVMERFLKKSNVGPFWQSIESQSFLNRNSAHLNFNSLKSEAHENGLSAELKIKWSNDKLWNKSLPGWGPGGWVTYQDWFPLQWFVQSLGSKAEYQIELNDTEGKYGPAGSKIILKGSGFAHVEKNWGKKFPASYMWLQGTSKDNTSHIAIAGGELEMNPLKINTYLVGYRSAKYQVDFNLGQFFETSFQTTADACKGRFELQAQNSSYRLRVEALAKPETFFWLSTPSENQYQRKGTVQSFQTEIRASLYQHGELLETLTFTDSALEFGGKLITDRSCFEK